MEKLVLFIFVLPVAMLPSEAFVGPPAGDDNVFSPIFFNFSGYPRPVFSFDVYAPPISSLYSQVFSTVSLPVDLSQAVARRFAGKRMAVVGAKMSQVQRRSNGDMTVPSEVARSRHFEAILKGAPPFASLGFSGAEAERSFYGYAPKYAEVIESPMILQISSTQIDTWNRDAMNATRPTRFVPGPLPRESHLLQDAPHGRRRAELRECPLTTRMRKTLNTTYVLQPRGTCPVLISSAAECFAAAKSVFVNSTSNFTYTAGDSAEKPTGCTAVTDGSDASIIHVFFNSRATEAECGANTRRRAGVQASLVRLGLELDLDAQQVRINMTGPNKLIWFGVGFNATYMGDNPNAVIMSGYADVTERQLFLQSSGTPLKLTVNVTENSVVNGMRFTSMTRAFAGKDAEYFSFDANTPTVFDFINAIGEGPTIGFHPQKTPSQIVLLPVETSAQIAGTCICSSVPSVPFGMRGGILSYVKTAQEQDVGASSMQFKGVDADARLGFGHDNKENSAWNIRTYTGGSLICQHGVSLLDADQDIPWPDQPLTYQLRFRFWAQEYDASYHTPVHHATLNGADLVEYDVPACARTGTAGCTRRPDGEWEHTFVTTGTLPAGGRLLAARVHCHGLPCLSVSLYRCTKNTTRCDASTGQLMCEETPEVNPHAARETSSDHGLPPRCSWAYPSPDKALPPPDVGADKYVLAIVRRTSASRRHRGERAWQDVYYTIDTASIFV